MNRHVATLGGALALLAVTSQTNAAVLTGPAGGGQPVGNTQPSAAVSYIVQTSGIFGDLGEIRLFAGNFAPGGFQFANGQSMPILDNEALYYHLGTTYGGDGQSTFALPDLRGRAAIHAGQGAGLTSRPLGNSLGSQTLTLAQDQMPAHSHTAGPSTPTGLTGGSQPHSTMQPSLALNYSVAHQGVFPSPLGSTVGETFIAQVKLRAGTTIPNGQTQANGQLLPINQNQALFSILGTTYGGDGRTNFALPDLRGRAPVGFGAAPGLTDRVLGEAGGTEVVTPGVANLPPHSHTLPAPGESTGVTGAGEPVSTMQPYLGLNYLIATQGVFPSREGTASSDTLVGEIRLFAGNFAPGGFEFADGRLLPINQNQALFSILGTTYGGDGRTNFALPDLRGRVALHFGQGPGMSNVELGQMLGSETVTLTGAQMPEHTHTVVPEPSAALLGLLGLGGAMMRRRRPA
jgi:MYXO-CTERM domain-containing protein